MHKHIRFVAVFFYYYLVVLCNCCCCYFVCYNIIHSTSALLFVRRTSAWYSCDVATERARKSDQSQVIFEQIIIICVPVNVASISLWWMVVYFWPGSGHFIRNFSALRLNAFPEFYNDLKKKNLPFLNNRSPIKPTNNKKRHSLLQIK